MPETPIPFEKSREVEKRSLSFATIEMMGSKTTQQDAHRIREIEIDGRPAVMAVVADGHGPDGDFIAQRTCEVLTRQDPEFVDPELIRQLFEKAATEFQDSDSGTTASMVFVSQEKALIGYVGDSEAWLAKKDGSSQTLTTPHRYGRNPKETERLDDSGANIWGSSELDDERKTTGRIQVAGRTLAVSRSIGDVYYSEFVGSEPEIIEQDLSDNDKFLIVASDGFWYFFEDRRGQKILKEVLESSENAEQAKEKFTELLEQWDLFDNVTVIVVDVSK